MNQYHIYEAIGRGKHSTVYKGRRKKSIEYYAIKSVDKSQKNKVLQEVRTLHSLDHPNVLKFYAWYETSAHLWLVLEYCVGGDLLTLLKQDARLPEESVHDFARDLVQALQFLHSKGVVYCDVKPSNILLDENGRLKLCDFGLARRLSEISKNSVQQLPQAKRGTPCYMAPELFQEGGVHSFGSDLWALGCVIYECYAGRPPFVSSSFTQLVNSILNEEPAPLCGSPSKEFEDLVKHLLIKDPAERIQWPELRDHCFWRSKLKQLPLPPQPAFASFLKSSQKQPKVVNGLQNGFINGEVAKGNVHGQRVPKVENQQIGADKRTAESTVSSKASTTKRTIAPVPFKEVSCKANIGVNLLRLSKIVKSNLQREAEGEAYRQPSSKGTVNDADFTLENNDQELDFAERGENDVAPEDEDGSAEPSAPEEKNEQVSCVSETENVDSDEIHGNGSPKNREEPAMERQPDETLKIESLRLEVAATPPGVGISRKGQRACGIVGERKKAPLPPSEDSSKTSVSLSQALWHPSDVSVRPIMSNRKVEKSPDAMFDPKVLCVDPLTCLDILKLQPEQIEAFFARIINNIAGAASPSSKSNTFRYIESICNNTDVSNLIINGPLMPLLVKTLRTTKVANLRIQIATIIGLLIRHATTIEDELAGSGIVAVLTETLRDSHEKVRRGAMAALGELLFYISTQNSNNARAASAGNESSAKESRSPSVWQVSGTTISLVASVLHKGEDDATQHYALKAIENIACQGGEWVMRFTTHGVLEDLCYIFKTTSKQEALRTTAGSCLVRLVRFNPSSIPLVLEKLTFSKLISGLSKGSIKLQQVYLNLLNMALVGSSVMTNMQKHLLPLMEEKSLVPSIVNMLEQGPEVLRGKSLVCAALLCKINRKWLHSLCSGKLLPVVERLAKEKDPYVQQCLEALIQTVISLVPVILEGISLDIQQVGQQLKRPGSAFQNASPFGKSQARSSIPLLPTILLLLKCIPFKDRIVNEQVLKQVASFMTRLETASFQGQEDFQSTVLRMLEVISQQSTTLLTYVDIFISHLLPSLASLYRKNSCGDTRFLCLKVFCDILIVFVDDMTSNLEDLKVDPGERSGIWGKERDHLKLIIRQHFLPLYPILLEDEDPIPMYAQKLLVMLLDLKCIEIADILQLKLVSQFFDFLQEDLSSINLHNVRLCLFVVCSPEVETKLLSKLHVVNKLMALLEFAHAKGMEDFLDPVLTVCRYFLIRNAGKHKGTTNGNLIAASNGLKGGHSFDQNMLIEDIADFARNAGLFLELCGSHEPRLAESASECLVLAVKAAPKVAAESILSNISELTKALETSSLIHNPALLSLLQRRLLQVLTVACREQRVALVNSQLLPAPVLQTSTIVPLENIIHKLRKSSLPHVADAAIDAATSTRKDLNEYSNKTLCSNKADFLEIVAGSTTKDEETKCNRKAVRRHLCALQLAASQSQ